MDLVWSRGRDVVFTGGLRETNKCSWAYKKPTEQGTDARGMSPVPDPMTSAMRADLMCHNRRKVRFGDHKRGGERKREGWEGCVTTACWTD